MNAEIDRMRNGDGVNLPSEIPPPVENLPITTSGIFARLEGDIVDVVNRDGNVLFRFNRNACPFQQQPIHFLTEIYSLGYNKGRIVGVDVTKAKMRDLLGPEL